MTSSTTSSTAYHPSVMECSLGARRPLPLARSNEHDKGSGTTDRGQRLDVGAAPAEMFLRMPYAAGGANATVPDWIVSTNCAAADVPTGAK
jgi:hypothetical protein